MLENITTYLGNSALFVYGFKLFVIFCFLYFCIILIKSLLVFYISKLNDPSETERLKNECTSLINRLLTLEGNLMSKDFTIHKLENELHALRQRASNQNKTSSQTNFTLKEVNLLLSICHPDKHNNSTISNDIAGKLIMLRAELKKGAK